MRAVTVTKVLRRIPSGFPAPGAAVVTLHAVVSRGNSTGAAQGSGLVAAADGLIPTNSHVVTTAGAGGGRVTPAGDR